MKFENEHIFRAYHIISGFIQNKKQYHPSKLECYDEKERKIMEEDVERLLSYFELIAIAYNKDDLDKDTIRLQIRSGIRDTFIFCEEYIVDRRERLKRPGLYVELEGLSSTFRREDDEEKKADLSSENWFQLSFLPGALQRFFEQYLVSTPPEPTSDNAQELPEGSK